MWSTYFTELNNQFMITTSGEMASEIFTISSCYRVISKQIFCMVRITCNVIGYWQNLQCDWLLTAHYDSIMYAFFFCFSSCFLGDQYDQI